MPSIIPSHAECEPYCAERQYCAAVSRQEQEDPIGSASPHRRYLFVEVPLPWTHDAEQSRHFPSGLADILLQSAEQGNGCRCLSFTSEFHPSPAGYRRVIEYRLPAAPNAFFLRHEYVVPADRVGGLASALLRDDALSLSGFDEWRESESGVRDLFVCTHGSHDSCCGVFGVPLFLRIGEHYAARSGGALRVWRTSHFGGHRHAPTLIDLPEGRYWAQVTPDLLDALILRKGSFADIARHYRGWGAIPRFGQAAEREAFAREGWAWIGYGKETDVRMKDDDTASVRIRYRSPDGSAAGIYEAEVSVSGKTVRTGGCGHAAGEAKQLTVDSIVKTSV